MGSSINKWQNYKMILRYEGTKYQGWQRQKEKPNTIQGKIEEVLSKMCGTAIEIHGSGRTDAGVHALEQVLSVKLMTEKSEEEIRDYMNFYLPEDIVIMQVMKVNERFHARLLATKKEYCYRVWTSQVPPVFERKYVYPFSQALDINAMRVAAKKLEGIHDFQAFTSTKKGKKSTVREIYEIRIEQVGDEIRFTYFGNGFLYHMVRILTGTLLLVGSGEIMPEDILSILASKDRAKSGPLVPGKGLTLVKVSYDK